MTTPPDDLMAEVRRELTAWHATHPRATFAEIECAVEARIADLRASLVQERTDAAWQDEKPACPHCGTTMTVRSRSTRSLTLPGEDAITMERAHVVCPACGTGLFPPG